MYLNSYERSLMNRLQRQMSKTEAENAISEIREALYGDPYTVIHGNPEFPEMKALIWAYFNNGWDKLSCVEKPKANGRFLVRCATSQEIYITSETEKHLLAHTSISERQIKIALSQLYICNENFLMETKTVTEKGETSLIKRNPEDTVQYLYRKGREGKSPVIIGKERELTNKVTVGICKENGIYYLFTAFYGEKAEREPWDRNIKTDAEREASEKFWATHALICTADEIDWERSA